ncbi:MAG TPA: NADH-quinone oxidoreductase subunit N [Acidimicrobiales bacterium]|nr:NADH-quinone oxidoreductase subunit N [Acidimicrobiales bacterium]
MLPDIDYRAISPELILSGTVLLVLTIDLFLKQRRKHWSMWVSFVGVATALGFALSNIGTETRAFGETYVVDSFAVLFKVFFLVVALVVLLLSLRYFRDGRFYQGEYYFLLLTSFLGMLTIVSSRDLLMLFISLEVVSAPGFLIAGFRKRDPRSNEAALKFFLIGILSAAVMLYGMSLLYGVTGTLTLDGIAAKLAAAPEGLGLAAVLFVVAGFAFKVSAVPFHFWAPDTYEGSPIPVAAFLSVASKAAGFAGLLQLMFVGFRPLADVWAPVFAILSVLTMSIGNLVAIQQRQAVRLLAYSSVAQAGYMLLPFALVRAASDEAATAINEQAFAASVLYILIYAVMNLGAFAVVTALSRESPGVLIEDFAGLGQRSGAIAVAMGAFMISLAGIPPTAGFWGKFFIFQAAINAEQAWLAIVMVVNSVVSLYYYAAIVKQMFLVPVAEPRPFRAPVLVSGVVALALAGVVAVGIFPDLLATFPPNATLP